ncbi:MAG TPA: LuxR C-terminal-related transcriptional regulator [Trebonia sp.]
MKGWVQRTEYASEPEAEPTAAMAVRHVPALLELMRGRDQDVLASFRAADRLTTSLAAPHYLLTRALRLYALILMGHIERAEQTLANLGEQDPERGEMHTAAATLRLAQDDPHTATSVLAPVLDDSAFVPQWTWLVHAFLLEVIAEDALNDPSAVRDALERALVRRERRGLGEHGGPGRCAGLASHRSREDVGGASPRLAEPLSKSEIRVLRYLPTNLSALEIARELSVSVSTVRTHIRHMFAKLGAHRRTEAVARARAFGLLASSLHPPDGSQRHCRGCGSNGVRS